MPTQMERDPALRNTIARMLAQSLRRVFFLSFFTVFAGLSNVNANANNGELKAFDIDAGPATRTLHEYARQADIQLGFLPDEVQAIHTERLIGRYTARDGLDRLLKGTGLVAKAEGESFLVLYTGEINDSPTGATAADISKSALSTEPDIGNAPTDTQRNPLEEIVVTGSNIRGAGGVGASTISFDRQQLADTGFATVEEFFQSLPQNLDEITPIGPIATGTSDLAGFNTQGTYGLNLRGLGPGSTLVLLNGRRRPGNINGRVVDISAIPLAMVERIELVTGGYSAVYGSDAVAGVVNVVTRQQFEGAETQLFYGGSSAGGERLNFSQAFGWQFGRGGLVVGYDFRDDQPLDATETGVLLPSPTSLAPIAGLFHIRGARKQHTGMLTGRFDLTRQIELYADAHLALGEYTSQLAYQITGCCDFDIHNVTETDQYSALAGARVHLGAGWMVDLSTLKGLVDNEAEDGTGITSPPGMITADDPRPAATRRENDRAELATYSIVADGPLGQIGGISLSAAVGLALREEGYWNATTQFATGDTEVFENIDRDVRSMFGELHIPILTQTGQRIEVSIAGRYDDYSDFGSTFNPQIGVEWAPLEKLAFRGSYSKAFRAPTLFELANQPRVRILIVDDPADPTGVTNATLFLRSGGNTELVPETADTYTVGMDWTPAERTAISISYFSIDYDGRIDTPDPINNGFTALENEALYEGLIDRSPSPSDIDAILDGAYLVINQSGIPFDPNSQDPFDVYENIATFDNRANNIALDAMSGFDLLMSTTWDSDYGEWSLGLNGVYYLDFERNITPTSLAIDQLNRPGRLVDLRLRGHVGWSRLAWNAGLYVNYVDSYRDDIADPPRPINSWTTVDLTVGIDASDVSGSPIAKGLKATLGLINLLDERPPVLGSNDVGLGYDAVNADPTGRFISLRLSKRW